MTPERWQRLETLFAVAQRVPRAECAAFLEQACPDDPEMRAELEALLQPRQQGDDFLEQPAIRLLNLPEASGLCSSEQSSPSFADRTSRSCHWPAVQAPEPDSSAVADLTRRKLGPYEVISRLGAGGMGIVFKARDTLLGRLVAIKVLPPAVQADKDRKLRFIQEARAASALNHPNIVTIYEVEEATDGTPYMVMEHIDGRPVRQMIAKGELTLKSVLDIAVQVAQGLSAAHERGIVHRDLKPENILVDGSGSAKILDFGIAKLASSQQELHESTAVTDAGIVTHSGMILGTAGYMSPEQACGKTVDFRTDQFSLGVTLYEMLTSKRPFERPHIVETLAAVIHEKPPAITQLNPQVPPPLQWIVERCLAKEPQERYPSTVELARDLALVRDHFSDVPVKTRGTAPATLPVSLTTLVGRETEVRSVRDFMREGVRLITLTGAGGSGKTRLALETARTVSGEFAGRVYFLELAPLSDPELVITAIAQAFGVWREPGKPTAQSVREQLGRSLESRTLLVLDNFEQVLSAAPFIGELLASSAKLSVLVTSREALHLYGEQELPVLPLPVPDSAHLSSVEMISRSPSVTLFVQRARASQPGFGLTGENAKAIAQLCGRLDGLPLAIELAAPGIKMLSPTALLGRFADPLQTVTRGAADAPARHQTMRRAIEWSYNLLPPEQQKLFRRLSVFVGGCTFEAAEAVCAAYNDLGVDLYEGLAALVDKSLIQQSRQSDADARFTMLETIRAYAAEQLSLSGEEAATLRAHAAYSIVLAEDGSNELLRTAPSSVWLARFDLEHANFRKALDWLIETGSAEWGMRMGAALCRFWEVRECQIEGQVYMTRILRLPAAQPRTRLRARALFGLCCCGAGAEAALAGKREALEIHRELGDRDGVLVALTAIGVLHCELGDYSSARARFEESLAIAAEAGNKMSVANCLINLATAMKLEGDAALARLNYQESLDVFRQLGDRSGIARSLEQLGDLALQEGDRDRAEELYKQAMALFCEIEDQWGIARSLQNLGNLARDRAEYARARLFYKDTLRMFRALGRTLSIAQLLEAFAHCAAAEHNHMYALTLAGAAAALRRTISIPLRPQENAMLDAGLEPARRTMGHTAAATFWKNGWAMQVESAIEYALAM